MLSLNAMTTAWLSACRKPDRDRQPHRIAALRRAATRHVPPRCLACDRPRKADWYYEHHTTRLSAFGHPRKRAAHDPRTADLPAPNLRARSPMVCHEFDFQAGAGRLAWRQAHRALDHRARRIFSRRADAAGPTIRAGWTAAIRISGAIATGITSRVSACIGSLRVLDGLGLRATAVVTLTAATRYPRVIDEIVRRNW